MTETVAIGPYRLLEPLGQGGMGIVYRARHVGSERAVALKTVKLPSPRWLDSIRREIHALTRIQHPGVVRIVDHGVHQGRPWYAMDLVEGESLRHFGQRIWSPYRRPSAPPNAVSATDSVCDHRGDSVHCKAVLSTRPRSHTAGGMPAAAGELTAVLQIMRRVCATLAFMHGEGFVNCDLKPENILLANAQPIIIDFGLTAHHPGGCGREALEAQRTQSGTLPYMSPEQIRGEFVDARSDLYSVGCLLYELVVGAQPFTGAPRTIRAQHLSSHATPPSSLVTGVPQGLERLILTLLSKALSNRFGYADEVAAILAELSADTHRLPEFPPARSYLYRPRFVGREMLVTQLVPLRDRASVGGAGALVLIGGESGVGKTRLAMELTRLSPGTRMQIVTSEASPLSVENGAALGAPPLHAVRPLLQAVADRCQEGGAEAAEHLLGHRRSVLALYEPLLAHVPANDALSPPMPLDVAASRHRLFTYLAETLAALAHEQPVLWVLDDLGWADELSLAFLRSLTAQYLESTPLFIVCAYRTEEVTEAVSALAQLSHVTHIPLPRLGENAVCSMIADMLARRDAQDGFVNFVTRQAEGNPFFVAEYLRTAISERMLYRDHRYSWQLVGTTELTPNDYDSLGLPRSLRHVIEHRLAKLSPGARQTVAAAAVLGRESAIETIRDVALLSDNAAAWAIDELIRRQVLEQPTPGLVRFAHDKLREVTYANVPADQLSHLHGYAAHSLEARWKDRSDAIQFSATLGHHFAAAHLPDRAAAHLKLAADHARSTYAHHDAIRLYIEAIAQVEQLLLSLSQPSQDWHAILVALYEALADVQSLNGNRDDARTAYRSALTGTSSIPPAGRARLWRKIGKTWETQHEHDDAIRSYGSARAELGLAPLDDTPEQRDEWIQVHIDELWTYYFLGRVVDMDRLVQELAPVIARHASPLQTARFLRTQWMRNLRRDRYIASEDTLSLARAARAASTESADPAQVLADQFGIGFVLLFNGQPAAASEELVEALRLAERGGDLARQARCLAYLSLAARQQGLVTETLAHARRCHDVAGSAGLRDYVAAARANRAWVSLQQGDHDAALQGAQEALDIWRSLALVFPFHWLALLPLIRVALPRGDISQAVIGAEGLLAPTQQYLPGRATDGFSEAVSCWKAGHPQGARIALESALRHLTEVTHE